MNKLVIVINGRGGVGKDTLCDIASTRFSVMNVSSITPIKEIATLCGWDGGKDDRARKFLSDLKRLTVDYNDYPTTWLMEKYSEFLLSDDEIMFIHIREGEEIAKFVNATDGVAKTLLIRGGDRLVRGQYGNVSDDDVENYNYDYYFTNDKPLEVGGEEFIALLNSIR